MWLQMCCHIVVVYPVERRQYTLDHRGDAHAQGRIPSFWFALSSRVVSRHCESTGTLANIEHSSYKMSYGFSLLLSLKQRLAIAIDMEEANRITPGKYPDVTKWPISQMDMPQQQDGWVMVHHNLLTKDMFVCTVTNICIYIRNSCGLFVIEVMEHWDGKRWTADFTQVICHLCS